MILPGLLGGGLLAGLKVWARAFGAVSGEPGGPRSRQRAALVGLSLLILLTFGVRSTERAALWRSAGLLNADAVSHHPDGRQAHLTRARAAARAGDLDGVAAGLRGATEAGYDFLHELLHEPLFARARSHPGVEAVYRELALTWIDRVEQEKDPNPAELNMLALAHEVLGDLDEAVRVLERAVEMGGTESELIRVHLARVRAERARSGRNPRREGQTPRPLGPRGDSR